MNECEEAKVIKFEEAKVIKVFNIHKLINLVAQLAFLYSEMV